MIIPDAALGCISGPIEAAVSAYKAVLGSLGSLRHGFRDGPQHYLHHGQVLHVLMRLKQGITYSSEACQSV